MIISISCFARSKLSQSVIAPVILFVIIPALAGLVPMLISSGKLEGRAHWSLAAYAVVLIFLGIGLRTGTKLQRLLFFVLLLALVGNQLSYPLDVWWVAIYEVASKLSGANASEQIAWRSLNYFAVGAVLQAAQIIYLFFLLPGKFIAEIHRDKPVS